MTQPRLSNSSYLSKEFSSQFQTTSDFPMSNNKTFDNNQTNRNNNSVSSYKINSRTYTSPGNQIHINPDKYATSRSYLKPERDSLGQNNYNTSDNSFHFNEYRNNSSNLASNDPNVSPLSNVINSNKDQFSIFSSFKKYRNEKVDNSSKYNSVKVKDVSPPAYKSLPINRQYQFNTSTINKEMQSSGYFTPEIQSTLANLLNAGEDFDPKCKVDSKEIPIKFINKNVQQMSPSANNESNDEDGTSKNNKEVDRLNKKVEKLRNKMKMMKENNEEMQQHLRNLLSERKGLIRQLENAEMEEIIEEEEVQQAKANPSGKENKKPNVITEEVIRERNLIEKDRLTIQDLDPHLLDRYRKEIIDNEREKMEMEKRTLIEALNIQYQQQLQSAKNEREYQKIPINISKQSWKKDVTFHQVVSDVNLATSSSARPILTNVQPSVMTKGSQNNFEKSQKEIYQAFKSGSRSKISPVHEKILQRFKEALEKDDPDSMSSLLDEILLKSSRSVELNTDLKLIGKHFQVEDSKSTDNVKLAKEVQTLINNHLRKLQVPKTTWQDSVLTRFIDSLQSNNPERLSSIIQELLFKSLKSVGTNCTSQHSSRSTQTQRPNFKNLSYQVNIIDEKPTVETSSKSISVQPLLNQKGTQPEELFYFESGTMTDQNFYRSQGMMTVGDYSSKLTSSPLLSENESIVIKSSNRSEEKRQIKSHTIIKSSFEDFPHVNEKLNSSTLQERIEEMNRNSHLQPTIDKEITINVVEKTINGNESKEKEKETVFKTGEDNHSKYESHVTRSSSRTEEVKHASPKFPIIETTSNRFTNDNSFLKRLDTQDTIEINRTANLESAKTYDIPVTISKDEENKVNVFKMNYNTDESHIKYKCGNSTDSSSEQEQIKQVMPKSTIPEYSTNTFGNLNEKLNSSKMQEFLETSPSKSHSKVHKEIPINNLSQKKVENPSGKSMFRENKNNNESSEYSSFVTKSSSRSEDVKHGTSQSTKAQPLAGKYTNVNQRLNNSEKIDIHRHSSSQSSEAERMKTSSINDCRDSSSRFGKEIEIEFCQESRDKPKHFVENLEKKIEEKVQIFTAYMDKDNKLKEDSETTVECWETVSKIKDGKVVEKKESYRDKYTSSNPEDVLRHLESHNHDHNTVSSDNIEFPNAAQTFSRITRNSSSSSSSQMKTSKTEKEIRKDDTRTSSSIPITREIEESKFPKNSNSLNFSLNLPGQNTKNQSSIINSQQCANEKGNIRTYNVTSSFIPLYGVNKSMSKDTVDFKPISVQIETKKISEPNHVNIKREDNIKSIPSTNVKVHKVTTSEESCKKMTTNYPSDTRSTIIGSDNSAFFSFSELMKPSSKLEDHISENYEVLLPENIFQYSSQVLLWLNSKKNDDTNNFEDIPNDLIETSNVLVDWWVDMVVKLNANQLSSTIRYLISTFSKPFVKFLVINRDQQGNTCLHYIIGHQMWDSFSIFDTTGLVDPDIYNIQGYTVMMLAATLPVSQNILNTHIQKLAITANLNLQSKEQGQTAVFLAALHDNDNTINLLCSLGANINIRDFEENTPLIMAVSKNNIKAVQAILNCANVLLELRNKEGKTALMIAENNNFSEIIKLFEQRRSVRHSEMSSYSKIISSSSGTSSSPRIIRKIN